MAATGSCRMVEGISCHNRCYGTARVQWACPLRQRGASPPWRSVATLVSNTINARALFPPNAWKGFSYANGFTHDSDRSHSHSPLQHGDQANSNGWEWQEPVLDAHLSSADRVVLALTRVAANPTDKAAAERVAISYGLALVTNSEVCVAPLLPPFGSTVDEDGEEGDGMALALPMEKVAGAARPLVPHKKASGLGSVLSAHGPASPTSAQATLGAALLSSLPSFRRPGQPAAPNDTERQPHPARPQGGLEALSHLVSEGGGGDDDEVDAERDGGKSEFAGYGTWANGGSTNGHGAANGATKASSGHAQGHAGALMGAAAAALSRVARVASSAADVPVPVGRAAAGAATAAAHAAQAAVARAAKATTQMLPNYGEPWSDWVVADDTRGGVRYIVIGAGPELRNRTPRELTTDLVTFETYNLGAKVNKRLYNEATALYARFMPLMMDFLEAVPDGNICFGGQGVGGSLAVMLQLMCCHRGLRFAKLLPAVAVDAPPVLCQVPLHQRRMWGAASREQQHQQHPQDQLEEVLEDLMSRTVLEELGLPQDAVRNLLVARPDPPAHTPPTGREPFLVMAEGAGATQPGDAGFAGVDPARAQVFRLVGKVVHVDTIGSASSRAAAAAAGFAAGDLSPVNSWEPSDGLVETDGESGEVEAVADGGAAAAAAGAAAVGAGRRLDVVMMGNIAGAAATAAAAAAVERLRLVTGGFQGSRRVAAAAVARGDVDSAALYAYASPVVVTLQQHAERKAAAASSVITRVERVQRVELEEVDPGCLTDDEDDMSAWGV